MVYCSTYHSIQYTKEKAPAPFVSYGGSFILTGMSALGVVQSVYRRRAEEEA